MAWATGPQIPQCHMFSPAVQTALAAAKCPAPKLSPSSQKAASAKPMLANPATAWQTRSSRGSVSLISLQRTVFFLAVAGSRRDAEQEKTLCLIRLSIEP